jgi:hypothetical protein
MELPFLFPKHTPDPGKSSALGNARLTKPVPQSMQGQIGVKIFTTDHEREKYRVEVAHTLRRRGKILESEKLKSHFAKKGTHDVGAANLGHSPKTGKVFPYPEEWLQKALIWVCIPNAQDKPTIYSHVGKPFRFHHSSLAGDGEVIGAGEWIVKKGKLLKISGNSGHYRPSIDMLYHSVLHLNGALQSNTTVFLYDSQSDQWIDYPVLDFIKKPTASGRYWVHPQAPPI